MPKSSRLPKQLGIVPAKKEGDSEIIKCSKIFPGSNHGDCVCLKRFKMGSVGEKEGTKKHYSKMDGLCLPNLCSLNTQRTYSNLRDPKWGVLGCAQPSKFPIKAAAKLP